ncbi:hypothetical protein VTK73DRAFT_481 [Phialemonium thermophilum]|uniref:DUF8021 domain-containing protein n=1 Tax=Phialemonium thermophilum TaxID=223376 RepID=A0ABR3XFD4_9PEZI
MMFRLSLSVCTLAVCLLKAGAAPVVSGCERDVLLAAASKYIAAQAAGNLDTLHDVLASNFTYKENNEITPIEKGVLSKALKIDHNRTTADTAACASFTELISASGPYTLATQIRHDPETLAITLIDSIAATKGAWLFDAAKTLQYVTQEDWSPIPADRRDSRNLLRSAADAYLDMWSNATASDAVPWGTPCTRLEGSVYTGRGLPSDSCTPGIPSNHNQKPNTHRRYVIDETMGSCSVLCLWEHMMNAADSHEFRLEGGKLRYVHTMTCEKNIGDVPCF